MVRSRWNNRGFIFDIVTVSLFLYLIVDLQSSLEMKIFWLFISMFGWPMLLQGQKGISADEFYHMLQTNDQAILFDARLETEFDSCRIPNAIYAGEKSVLLEHLQELPRTSLILVYCEYESRSKEVIKLLKKRGFKNVFYLKDGFEEWQNMGFPLDSTRVSGSEL